MYAYMFEGFITFPGISLNDYEMSMIVKLVIMMKLVQSMDLVYMYIWRTAIYQSEIIFETNECKIVD